MNKKFVAGLLLGSGMILLIAFLLYYRIPRTPKVELTLGRALQLSGDDLREFATVPPEKGCYYQASSPNLITSASTVHDVIPDNDMAATYPRIVERLLELRVWAMGDRAPGGCERGIEAEEYNVYKFERGQLALPPSAYEGEAGQFDRRFVKIKFGKDISYLTALFCAERSELQRIVRELREDYPRFMECQF